MVVQTAMECRIIEGAMMPDEIGMRSLVPALFLRAKQEREKKGEVLTYTEVHKETGITWDSALRWLKDRITRGDFATEAVWCDYFGVNFVVIRETSLPPDFDDLLKRDADAALKKINGLFVP